MITLSMAMVPLQCNQNYGTSYLGHFYYMFLHQLPTMIAIRHFGWLNLLMPHSLRQMNQKTISLRDINNIASSKKRMVHTVLSSLEMGSSPSHQSIQSTRIKPMTWQVNSATIQNCYTCIAELSQNKNKGASFRRCLNQISLRMSTTSHTIASSTTPIRIVYNHSYIRPHIQV